MLISYVPQQAVIVREVIILHMNKINKYLKIKLEFPKKILLQFFNKNT